MFSLNEKVVYPGHGVAKISRIVEKKVAGNTIIFFELKFINKEMTILVPVCNLETVGIRRLSSNKSIDAIFKLLSKTAEKPNNELTTGNWNKRNKEYQCKLRTGDLSEICKIYRDLKQISLHKELSFGEKNLLQETEMLLVEEIALVMHVNEEKAIEHLRSLVNDFNDASILAKPPSQMMVSNL